MKYRSNTSYPYDCTAKLREIVVSFAMRTCGLNAKQRALPGLGGNIGVVVYCGIVKGLRDASYPTRVVTFNLARLMDTKPRDRLPAWGRVLFVGDTHSYQGGRLRCLKMWDYPGKQVAFVDSEIARCSRCGHKRPIRDRSDKQIGQRCVRTDRSFLWRGDHWRAQLWLGLPMAHEKPCPHFDRKHWNKYKSLLRRAGVPQVCRFCREDLNDWHENDKTAHHIIAVDFGGLDTLDNLDWACWPCHEKFTAMQFGELKKLKKDDGIPF